NSVCHRDYSIKGTEIQIKMFDDRLVFETPGKLPGIVRTDNIRHTHFSRNPKIAEYLKAYDYVKEFGEGVDRMCRELSAVGTKDPEYHLVSFLMKATVWANVLEDGQEKSRDTVMPMKETDSEGKKRARKGQETITSIIKANPFVSVAAIAQESGLSVKTVRNLIDEMRKDNLIVRIGSDKGGYWQLLK
ncbi:MAG: ATP-binding protein, partial [Candidatus Cryptobacteroides sp.]